MHPTGWRFRWDRRVLDTEPVDPFAFLADVRCIARVMAGSESEVMPPASAERFATAIPGAVLELVAGVGHHVELEAPERVAARILELVSPRTPVTGKRQFDPRYSQRVTLSASAAAVRRSVG